MCGGGASVLERLRRKASTGCAAGRWSMGGGLELELEDDEKGAQVQASSGHRARGRGGCGCGAGWEGPARGDAALVLMFGNAGTSAKRPVMSSEVCGSIGLGGMLEVGVGCWATRCSALRLSPVCTLRPECELERDVDGDVSLDGPAIKMLGWTGGGCGDAERELVAVMCGVDASVRAPFIGASTWRRACVVEDGCSTDDDDEEDAERERSIVSMLGISNRGRRPRLSAGALEVDTEAEPVEDVSVADIESLWAAKTEWAHAPSFTAASP